MGRNHRTRSVSWVLAGLLIAACACDPGEPEDGAAAPSEPAAAAATPPVPAEEAVPPVPATETPTPGRPYVRVLGIAQDGGLPHAECGCAQCMAAMDSPAIASGATSLAVVDDDAGPVLVDVAPSVPEQLRLLRDWGDRPAQEAQVDRAPVSSILLTHAHVGHYAGLIHFGFEVLDASGIQVRASDRMAEYLSANEPWARLFGRGKMRLQPTRAGSQFAVSSRVQAVSVTVPHRDELSDTVAWRLTGPNATVVHVPDIAPWKRWEDASAIDRLFEGADVAFVDGTFYSGDELPDRDLSQIGHPLIVDTMERLDAARTAGLRVVFIHLNHSNPALRPDSAERAAVLAAGYEVASVGMAVAL